MKRTSVVVAFVTLLCPAVLCAAEQAITFEGRYEYRTDAESLEMLGEQVCFFPSTPSSENVPRPAGDRRVPWFCFANSKQAAHLLGFALDAQATACGFTGHARITVTNYTRYAGEGDDNDVATLDVVLEKSKPEPLSCAK
ncbi:MAG: hypothetical protein NDI73_04095 [Desulfuromonadales bacterium]|nr:hypothetical protein [Desulfuromonadales bacterium]